MSNLANRDYTLLRPPPNKSIVLSPRYDGVEIHQGQYLATIPWDFFVRPKTKAELADEVCQMIRRVGTAHIGDVANEGELSDRLSGLIL